MMRIKSITDVITNSSDETYIYRLGKGIDLEEFRKKLREVIDSDPDSRSSGMGGILEVYLPSEIMGASEYPEEWFSMLPDEYLWVDVDHGYLTDTVTKFLEDTLGEPLSEEESDELYGPACKDLFYNAIPKLAQNPEDWDTWCYFSECCCNYDPASDDEEEENDCGLPQEGLDALQRLLPKGISDRVSKTVTEKYQEFIQDAPSDIEKEDIKGRLEEYIEFIHKILP